MLSRRSESVDQRGGHEKRSIQIDYKIRRCSDYLDMATFLKPLGLMPSA
jgi:hypothetical protein